MIIAHAKGRLRHRFFGEYSCVICLQFTDRETAAYARRVLGPADWEHAASAPSVLVGVFDASDPVNETFKAHGLAFEPCGWRECEGRGKKKKPCKGREIGALTHSVDYGPTFTLDVDISAVCVDPQQLKLPCLEASP